GLSTERHAGEVFAEQRDELLLVELARVERVRLRESLVVDGAIGRREHEQPLVSEHVRDPGEQGGLLAQVLHHLEADDEVERAGGEVTLELPGVAVEELQVRRWVALAAVADGEAVELEADDLTPPVAGDGAAGTPAAGAV